MRTGRTHRKIAAEPRLVTAVLCLAMLIPALAPASGAKTSAGTRNALQLLSADPGKPLRALAGLSVHTRPLTGG